MTELDSRTSTADASPSDTRGLNRRQILLTGGVVAAAAAVTAACGSSSSSTASSSPAASTPAASTPAASSPAAASSSAPAASGVQVATTDVPVGGGKLLEKEQIVVTQPTAGTFKAFTAVCTHQGCTVAGVANGSITCACHNSTFSAADGSVTGGPANGPLAAIPVTVSGTTINVQA
jgi:Rieske Fe-S protein